MTTVGFLIVFDMVRLVVAWTIAGASLGVCIWALADCATTPPQAFQVEGKRTKPFWLGLTALATGITLLTLPVYSLSISGLAILMLVIPGVYLADVRPSVRYHRRKR